MRDVWADRIAAVIASTGFSGFSPIAPGTVGSAIAVILLWWIPVPPPALAAAILVLLFFIGVWSATRAETLWGHDAGRINIDEVAGMIIAVLFVPRTIWVYSAAFILFRLFDIVKPYPANVSQRLARGWGVMVDDVFAGIYANLLLQVMLRLSLLPG